MQCLLIILSSPARESWAQSVVAAASSVKPLIIVATPADAARYLVEQAVSPSHIILDIGQRGHEVLEEIDALAQQCAVGTRVVAVGDTNDILLFRAILARGVLDYLPYPAGVEALIAALTAPIAMGKQPAIAATATPARPANKRVMLFMSAALGDGASTIALNAAYAISQLAGGNTVLVDMDYQFGMVAKHLDLQSQYGIGDLFDHPERGVDAILIKRMVASYRKLDVITAPTELRYLPIVKAEAIRDLIATLSASYDNVIIDVPHVWLPWVATAAEQSTHVLMISQLWLKSVSHAARLMRALREIGVGNDRIVSIINRSGAKFKEAIEPKDFERVCGTKIRYTVANDIKTIVMAEASPSTIIELPMSPISQDIERIARGLLGLGDTALASDKRGGLFSKRKG
jgi:pilus assembly protein CpaE